MRLAPHAGVPPHVDIQYYWRIRTRVHIPVITHPDIKRCGGEIVHMAEGEAWTFDNWRSHQVINDTDIIGRRVHLTLRHVRQGSNYFWKIARPHLEEKPESELQSLSSADPKAFQAVAGYLRETYAGDPVMPPGEVDYELSKLATDVHVHPANDRSGEAVERFLGFLAGFRATNGVFCGTPKVPSRQHCHCSRDCSIRPKRSGVPGGKGDLPRIAGPCEQRKVRTGNSPHRLSGNGENFPVLRKGLRCIKARASTCLFLRFDHPVFIVAAPRSGSSHLFECLSANEEFWTLGGEGHDYIENIAALNPLNRDYEVPII